MSNNQISDKWMQLYVKQQIAAFSLLEIYEKVENRP